jgi:hypothetical protein
VFEIANGSGERRGAISISKIVADLGVNVVTRMHPRERCKNPRRYHTLFIQVFNPAAFKMVSTSCPPASNMLRKNNDRT